MFFLCATPQAGSVADASGDGNAVSDLDSSLQVLQKDSTHKNWDHRKRPPAIDRESTHFPELVQKVPDKAAQQTFAGPATGNGKVPCSRATLSTPENTERNQYDGMFLY